MTLMVADIFPKLPDRWDAGLPAGLATVIGDREATLVWVNDFGGPTYELAGDAVQDRRFVKWLPAGVGADLAGEAVRLDWLAGRIPAPRVLASGADAEGQWLVTAAIDGETAISPRWRAEPARAVRAVGVGLRLLHDTLPVGGCPFGWAAEARVADASARVAAGSFDAERWSKDRPGDDLQAALARAQLPPPVDRLVVCHGDACSPNTLIDDAGDYCATVDFGGLGVADRWADLAIATLSTTWNYGPGWEQPLLDAYGVAADPERTDYYRLLWALDP